jgi:hypothetical protein
MVAATADIFFRQSENKEFMPDGKMLRATDLAITEILTANAILVLDDNELEPTTKIPPAPCCDHNCRVTTSGYITSQSAYDDSDTAKNISSRAKKKKSNGHLEPHLPSDSGTAHQIEESREDFDNGKSIINQSLKADLLAVEEAETYLNQKEIFLEASKDSVHWQQDRAHDQARFHFVMSGIREDRSQWLASDARYVRIRLAEIVGNLAYELKILKATVKQ